MFCEGGQDVCQEFVCTFAGHRQVFEPKIEERVKETLESLLALMEEGKIDEAENRLYDLTSGEEDEDRHNLEAGLLFYYILNGKDDDFLEEHDFSREEIMTGIQDLADRYGLSGIAEAFRA